MAEIPTFSGDVAISAIVFFERVRQLKKVGVSAKELENYLTNNEIEINIFSARNAYQMPDSIIEDDDVWRRLARDAMISSQVGPNDILVTNNVKDFKELGISLNRIRSTDNFFKGKS
jgi:porphobilinogen deaminase